jgi:hypothetical protein
MTVSNLSLSKALPALIFTTPDSAALAALPTPSGVNSVLFVVGMALRAMSAIGVGISLVLCLDAGTAQPVAGARDAIDVLFGIFMPLWAVGDVGFPAISISDFVLAILNGGAPVQVWELIVIGVVVAMTTLLSFGSWAYEVLKHENMDCHLLGNSVIVDCARSIFSVSASYSDLGKYASLKLSRSAPPTQAIVVKRSNSPMVGDFVVGKSKYGQPSFITDHSDSVTRLQSVTPSILVFPKSLERQGV